MNISVLVCGMLSAITMGERYQLRIAVISIIALSAARMPASTSEYVQLIIIAPGTSIKPCARRPTLAHLPKFDVI